jgi:hypothetical protein
MERFVMSEATVKVQILADLETMILAEVPDALRELIRIEKISDNALKVTTNKFMGQENFKRLAGVLQQTFGAEYIVSNPKEKGYFTVAVGYTKPAEKTPETSQPAQNNVAEPPAVGAYDKSQAPNLDSAAAAVPVTPKPEAPAEKTSSKVGTLERFKLGKGVTREFEGTWNKEYIELEVKLPEKATDKDFIANFMAAEFMIDQLLEQPKTAAPEKKAAEPQVKITMAPAEIDAMPSWIASQWVRKDDGDRKARPGEDAWMKEEECKDPRLLEMLREGNGKIELPGVYAFERKIHEGYTTGIIIRHGPKKRKKN